MDMAAEYRRNAEVVLTRIQELRDSLPTDKAERAATARRINTLEVLYAELMSTARQLESYYNH